MTFICTDLEDLTNFLCQFFLVNSHCDRCVMLMHKMTNTLLCFEVPTTVTATEATEAELRRRLIRPFDSVTWYKGSTDAANAIAYVDSTGTVEYYGDFCTEADPCSSSIKGTLDNITATLTINFVNLDDEDHYYYSGQPDQGLDFVTVLVVNG